MSETRTEILTEYVGFNESDHLQVTTPNKKAAGKRITENSAARRRQRPVEKTTDEVLRIITEGPTLPIGNKLSTQDVIRKIT